MIALLASLALASEPDLPPMLWQPDRVMDVRICWGDVPTIVNALVYLQSYGWEFGTVRIGGCLLRKRPKPGELWAMMLDPEDEKFDGMAGLFTPFLAADNEWVLRAGLVRVKPSYERDMLAWVHEFGHSLGLPHNTDTMGTPMCPSVGDNGCAGFGSHRMWRSDWEPVLQSPRD